MLLLPCQSTDLGRLAEDVANQPVNHVEETVGNTTLQRRTIDQIRCLKYDRKYSYSTQPRLLIHSVTQLSYR